MELLYISDWIKWQAYRCNEWISDRIYYRRDVLVRNKSWKIELKRTKKPIEAVTIPIVLERKEM